MRRASRRPQDERKRRIVVLGFYRVASSFLAELERTHAALVEQVFVVDFNPTVYHSLKARGVKVYYGDIAHVDTLTHAGIADAEIVIFERAGFASERNEQREAGALRPRGQTPEPRSSPRPTFFPKRRRSTRREPTT